MNLFTIAGPGSPLTPQNIGAAIIVCSVLAYFGQHYALRDDRQPVIVVRVPVPSSEINAAKGTR